MVQSPKQKKRVFPVSAVIAAACCIVAVSCAALFGGFDVAQGANPADTTTLGIGSTRSGAATEADSLDAAAKLGYATGDSVSDTPVSDTRVAGNGTAVQTSTSDSLKKAATRTITVNDPDPVVVLAAVDMGNESTIAAAATIGTTNPLPTAPQIEPDTSGEGWMTGLASGYDVASSSTLTASGRAFSDDCVTVAVPQGQEYLLGHAVEIVYGGKTVVATVTDTGGFAPYGRALDLAGGVYAAFGAPVVSDWGVRTVSYRFL